MSYLEEEKLHISKTWRCDFVGLERARGACWQRAKQTDDERLYWYLMGAGNAVDELLEAEYSTTAAGFLTTLKADFDMQLEADARRRANDGGEE